MWVYYIFCKFSRVNLDVLISLDNTHVLFSRGVTIWYQSLVPDGLLGCGVLTLGRMTLNGDVLSLLYPGQLGDLDIS